MAGWHKQVVVKLIQIKQVANKANFKRHTPRSRISAPCLFFEKLSESPLILGLPANYVFDFSRRNFQKLVLCRVTQIMIEIYMERFREVFASSDINWGILYLCWLLQLVRTSDLPHLFFILRNFSRPLLIRTPPLIRDLRVETLMAFSIKLTIYTKNINEQNLVVFLAGVVLGVS